MFSSYDYESVSAEGAGKMMAHLLELSKKQKKNDKLGSFAVDVADEFEYKDPVDGSVSSQQVNFVVAMAISMAMEMKFC